MHTAPPEWQYSRRSYEFANGFFMGMVSAALEEEGATAFATNTAVNPSELDEKVKLKEKFIVPAFGTLILQGRTEQTMMLDHVLHVITQAPYPEDEANLPNGLYVLSTYTQLNPRCHDVAVVVRNGMSRLIHIASGRQIGRVITANAVPDPQASPELLRQLDNEESVPDLGLSTAERQSKLLEILESNGSLDELKNWLLEVATSARQLLLEFHSVFSLEPNEMGCTDTTEHVIEVTNSEPFRERFRHIAPPIVDEVRQHIQEMLDGGAIHPSQSPWCNAVVLVRKKDGSLHFCIDFRKLNERTKKDAYPLPRMQEQMESMVGARHFSCINLKSGFWQVKMAEESQQYTAFIVISMGVYEFLRMPFGLCNTPATFQCLMQECLGELNLTYALIYWNDVIVFSSTPEEHLDCLRAVLEQFLEHELKLKPSKCHFFRMEIDYLGHKVSADGMTPGTDNVRGIAEMAPPTTVTEVRCFLGRVDISPEALVAYEELKMRCMTSPVLAFADFEKPFLLETNASKEGLGAVLSQKQEDGRYHPVAFTSHALHGGEKNYHSSKLEFLALKWAITEQFREYL